MTVLVFELFGRDSSAGRVLDNVGDKSDRAGKRLNQLGRDADGAARSFNPLAVALTGVHRALVQNVAALAKTTAMVGGLGATALTVAPYLVKAAQEIWAVGQAAIGASPALLAQAAAVGVVFGALKLGFSGFGAALKEANTPAELKKVTEALADLHPEARKSAQAVRDMRPEWDKLQKSIQGAIFRDLAGDIKAAGSALMGSMAPGMVRVGLSTNTVLRDLLSWGKSTEGIKATANLTNATATAMDRLAPQISRVVTSLGNMIGRISEVSMAAGAGGLGGALDWLADRMDRVNAMSVSANLATLRNTYDTVKDAVVRTWEAVQTATRFYQEHRTEIGLVADAVSILAIRFGGPAIAAVAAVGLIIRHWDDLKAAHQGLVDWLAAPVRVGVIEDLRSASETIVPAVQGAWQAIWDAIGPRLEAIWDKVQNKLLPAWSAFMEEISPFVAFCVDVLGPVVADTFGAILDVISGVLDIITGILKVFTGLFKGDWGLLWEGVKLIFSGAWDAIVGLLQTFLFGKILGILGRLPGAVGGLFSKAGQAAIDAVRNMGVWVERSISSLIERIPGALGSTVRLLYEAGRGIVQGLINGIMSMINAAGNAMASVARKIRNMLPFSPAKEGPLSGAGSPDLAGRKIPAMVAGGILGGLPDVAGAAGRLAGAAAFGASKLPPLPPAGPMGSGGGVGSARIVFDFNDQSAGAFERLVLETLRRAIRTKGGGDLIKYLGTGHA
ncbi:MAG: phage tail protein [Pseudonocardiaceae bacterium]